MAAVIIAAMTVGWYLKPDSDTPAVAGLAASMDSSPVAIVASDEQVLRALRHAIPFDQTGDGYDDTWRYTHESGRPCRLGPGPQGHTQVVSDQPLSPNMPHDSDVSIGSVVICEQFLPDGTGRMYA